MIGFSILAVQVVLWQGQDISVNIVSESDEGVSDVKISVLNKAGATLLFYENAQMSGVVEYLSEEGWVDFCNVCYTSDNDTAISQQYGGTFAELEPGEDWNVVIPKDKVAMMQDGTYRVKLTYITEKKYNMYLDSAFENRSDISDSSDDLQENISDGNVFAQLSEKNNFSEPEEEFIAASLSEVFVKTFDYEVPENFVAGDINISDGDIFGGGYNHITDKKNGTDKTVY